MEAKFPVIPLEAEVVYLLVSVAVSPYMEVKFPIMKLVGMEAAYLLAIAP